MAYATLSLGSNLGDKCAFINKAVRGLEKRSCLLHARSSNWRTPPWGPIPQDWYINICIAIETRLTPYDLLDACLAIEKSLGRSRDVRWGPRTIDMDILTYDNQTIASPTLTLPHPRIHERAFVLVPLAEIAPHLCLGICSVHEALAKVDSTDLEKLSSPEYA
jgi:2-amino-4-hydroxy-6-hydroxymethyldihydropteridine diphosphokinase